MTAPTRPPLPEAQHRIDLYEPGTLVGATAVCLGGPDNECRWWCAEPGDDYVWRYIEDAPPVDLPVHRDQLALEVPA